MPSRNVTLSQNESISLELTDISGVAVVSIDPGGSRGRSAANSPINSYDVTFEKLSDGTYTEINGSPVSGSSLDEQQWATGNVDNGLRITVTNTGNSRGTCLIELEERVNEAAAQALNNYTIVGQTANDLTVQKRFIDPSGTEYTGSVGVDTEEFTVTAGDNLDGGGTATLGNSVTLNYSPGELGLPNHHVEYASSLTDEEIARFQMDTGRILEVYQLDLRLKGGGTDANLTVEVFDVDDNSIIASTTAGTLNTGTPIGSSTAGATITVRLTTGGSGPYNLTTSGIINITDS